MCMSKYATEPGTWPSSEAELPTSPSPVCHEMMWGVHRVSVIASLSFFLTLTSYLYRVIQLYFHQRHVAFTDFMYSQQRQKIQIPTVKLTRWLSGECHFFLVLWCYIRPAGPVCVCPAVFTGMRDLGRTGSGLHCLYLKQPSSRRCSVRRGSDDRKLSGPTLANNRRGSWAPPPTSFLGPGTACPVTGDGPQRGHQRTPLAPIICPHSCLVLSSCMDRACFRNEWKEDSAPEAE